MAVDLTPTFHAAEEAFRRAQTAEERIQWLRAMRTEINTCLDAAEAELLPPVSPHYTAAWEAFQRDLPQMLRERRGQYVVYRGEKRLAFAKNDMDLYHQCRRDGIPEDEFLVLCVEPVPPYDQIGCSVLTTEPRR
jgi:hypothetical protein